jgi:hypothetical protein
MSPGTSARASGRVPCLLVMMACLRFIISGCIVSVVDVEISQGTYKVATGRQRLAPSSCVPSKPKVCTDPHRHIPYRSESVLCRLDLAHCRHLFARYTSCLAPVVMDDSEGVEVSHLTSVKGFPESETNGEYAYVKDVVRRGEEDFADVIRRFAC